MDCDVVFRFDDLWDMENWKIGHNIESIYWLSIWYPIQKNKNLIHVSIDKQTMLMIQLYLVCY